jgi:hypothetical protein
MRNSDRIKPFLNYIESEWNSAPDLRFGQLLTNLGIITNNDMENYYREIEDYPIPHEYVRQIISWGKMLNDTTYPVYKYIYIKDLAISHIKSILKTQKHISDRMKNILQEELKYRKKYKLK